MTNNNGYARSTYPGPRMNSSTRLQTLLTHPRLCQRSPTAPNELPSRSWPAAPTSLKAKQEEKLDHSRQPTEALAPHEDAATRRVNEIVRKVNQKTQTIPTAKLLKQLNYGDFDVAHRLLTGFHHVGTMGGLAAFEGRSLQDIVSGADLTWLARTAYVASENLKEQVAQIANDEAPADIYDTTNDPITGEVAKGWTDGPDTEGQIHQIVGDKLWAVDRRFGATQKEKVRQHVDCSEFINVCTTTADKAPVAGVDAIAIK